MVAAVGVWLPVVLAALGSGGLVAAIGTWRKVPAEREAIVVDAAKGAAEILSDVITTLREENARLWERIRELEQAINTSLPAAQQRIQQLEDENAGLRRRVSDLEAEVAVIHSDGK